MTRVCTHDTCGYIEVTKSRSYFPCYFLTCFGLFFFFFFFSFSFCNNFRCREELWRQRGGPGAPPLAAPGRPWLPLALTARGHSTAAVTDELAWAQRCRLSCRLSSGLFRVSPVFPLTPFFQPRSRCPAQPACSPGPFWPLLLRHRGGSRARGADALPPFLLSPRACTSLQPSPNHAHPCACPHLCIQRPTCPHSPDLSRAG